MDYVPIPVRQLILEYLQPGEELILGEDQYLGYREIMVNGLIATINEIIDSVYLAAMLRMLLARKFILVTSDIIVIESAALANANICYQNPHTLHYDIAAVLESIIINASKYCNPTLFTVAVRVLYKDEVFKQIDRYITDAGEKWFERALDNGLNLQDLQINLNIKMALKHQHPVLFVRQQNTLGNTQYGRALDAGLFDEKKMGASASTLAALRAKDHAKGFALLNRIIAEYGPVPREITSNLLYCCNIDIIRYALRMGYVRCYSTLIGNLLDCPQSMADPDIVPIVQQLLIGTEGDMSGLILRSETSDGEGIILNAVSSGNPDVVSLLLGNIECRNTVPMFGKVTSLAMLHLLIDRFGHDNIESALINLIKLRQSAAVLVVAEMMQERKMIAKRNLLWCAIENHLPYYVLQSIGRIQRIIHDRFHEHDAEWIMGCGKKMIMFILPGTQMKVGKQSVKLAIEMNDPEIMKCVLQEVARQNNGVISKRIMTLLRRIKDEQMRKIVTTI